MSKLPSITSQKVIKVLEKRGFVLERTKGSPYTYYNPETKRRVVVPVHKKDLPKGTLLEILKEAGLTREELKELS